MADFTLTSGHIVTLTSDGLSNVFYEGENIATGHVILWDGNFFYPRSHGSDWRPTVASKFIASRTNGAVVTHCYTGLLNATAIYYYTITGDEIQIDVTVCNRSQTTSIDYPTFCTPRLQFAVYGDAVASSNNLGHADTHLTSPELAYPCGTIPIACTYVATVATGGAHINFAVWPREDPYERFMTNEQTDTGSGFPLANIFFKSIPPGGSANFKFSFLFSSSTDWKVLMAPYKATIRALAPVTYSVDARPWIFFASIDSALIREDNPYGYNDGNGTVTWRRLDTSEGCQAFVDLLLPAAAWANYQGVLCWQPQGVHPRGVSYRPDFDNWPTQANCATLFGGFTTATPARRFGLQARPGINITAGNYTTDSVVKASDYAEAYASFSARLDWAIGFDITAMYLDSFVSDLMDHKILKLMRGTVGADFAFYTEGSTAASCPYSGIYTHFTYSSGNYVFDVNFPRLHWLYPDIGVFGKFSGSNPSGGLSQLFDDMMQLKLSPSVQDYEAPSQTAGQPSAILKDLVPIYIDGDNQWI